MSYVLTAPATDRFVETSIHRQVLGAVDYAITMRSTALVTGRPGNGKSTSARRLNDTDPKAVYLMIGRDQKTVRRMYLAILAAFDAVVYRKNNTDLGAVVYANLPNWVERGHYLLVDEYQILDVDALRELLNFNEIHRLPIVLIGNEGRLKRTGADVYTYDQIRSRIGKHTRLKPLMRDDFIKIGVEYNVEGKEAYEELVTLGLQTSMRAVIHVLDAAREMRGPSGSLRIDNLREAVAFLTKDATTNVVLATPGLRRIA